MSEQSAAQMEKFAVQASKAAKNLGATTLDYSNAALLYYQQGDSPEQVAQKAELTVKMANVLGTSAAEVSNYMTSIWNNFAEGGDNLEYYADKDISYYFISEKEEATAIIYTLNVTEENLCT